MVSAWIANSIPIINFATHYYTMPSQLSTGIQQVLGGDPLTNDLVKLYDASGLSVTFFSGLLLILSAISIIKISRMADVKFPTKLKFKNYFMALWRILKVESVGVLNRLK